MIELKPISREAISSALEKAERYRLLNEPREAESICRDVLFADAGNQHGLITLLLALTDQFAQKPRVHLNDARGVLEQVKGDYEQAYYEGVILERWGKAQLAADTPRYVANDWLRKAMDCYANAENVRPTGNDDAILRWNACARIIDHAVHADGPQADPAPTQVADGFDDEVPLL